MNRMRMTGYALLLVPLMVHGGDLKLFTTDGCSSFPDGTIEQQSLWMNCCIKHDLAYWKGGTYQQRLEADRALESCVASLGQPEIASIMLAGVRAGGSPFFPTSYRWGYGWPYLRGYRELSSQEKQEVKARLTAFKSIINSIPDETD